MVADCHWSTDWVTSMFVGHCSAAELSSAAVGIPCANKFTKIISIWGHGDIYTYFKAVRPTG